MMSQSNCPSSLVLPKVSVIMNCLNCSKYLREAIDSVYAQTYKDWEIIFWDNASTDNSAEIAKSYDEKLRYFSSAEIVPLGKARNWAIEKARGKYIAFLDCDDMWLPEKLQMQLSIFEANPDVDFIYANYYRIIMPRTDKLIVGLKKRQPDGHVFERFLYHYPVNMQTVMLRKSVIDKLDLVFDETLNLSEEYDLFMRILYNSKAAYINEPLVIYRVHSGMSSLKYNDKYPDENEYTIMKLKRMFPIIEMKYHSAIKYANAKIGYWRARAAMIRGEYKSARRYLHHYKFIDYKFFILFLLTYFPPFIWRFIHYLKDAGFFTLSMKYNDDNAGYKY